MRSRKESESFPSELMAWKRLVPFLIANPRMKNSEIMDITKCAEATCADFKRLFRERKEEIIKLHEKLPGWWKS